MVDKSKCSIRKYTEEHYSKTIQWLNQEDIRQLFGITYEVSLSGHAKWIESNPQVEVIPLYYAEEYVGNIVLNNSVRHRSSYLQIYIGSPQHRGGGLGTKFMQLALGYIFENRKFHRVWLHVRDYNTTAIRLYEGLGFVSEGTERESVWVGDKFINQIRMSLLAREFEMGDS